MNVHTIHTEMEGGMMSWTFDKFLDLCKDFGVEFLTLKEAKAQATLEYNRIEMGYIPGRAGKVAVQL